MAQKAVCLFEILLSQNLLRSDICTKYITSHSLDFCLSNELKNFKGKVALIDDIENQAGLVLVFLREREFHSREFHHLFGGPSESSPGQRATIRHCSLVRTQTPELLDPL